MTKLHSFKQNTFIHFFCMLYGIGTPVSILICSSQRASYMQFRAARSRCTILFSARYSIPFAIWMHMSDSRLHATVAFKEEKQTAINDRRFKQKVVYNYTPCMTTLTLNKFYLREQYLKYSFIKLGTFTKKFISRLLIPVFVCSITACGGRPGETCHMQWISGEKLEVWQNTKAIFHLPML